MSFLPWRSYWSLVLVLMGFTTLASGCFGNPGHSVSYPPSSPPGPTGGLAVRAALAKGMGENQEIGRVIATLSRGTHIVEQNLVVDPVNMTASGTLSGVLIGTWQLRVDVFGQQEELLYTGSASILVEEGKTTSTGLTLTAAPGELVVELDLSEFASYELLKGKLVFGNGPKPELIKEFTRYSGPGVVVTVEELPPRTHDLRVELYKSTYHSYNCIYQGPWQVATIRPGKPTQLSWSPAWGLVEIIGVIDLPPPSPTHVTASLDESGILITWAPVTPPEDDLQGYRVYAQLDAFTGFQLVAELSEALTTYYYQPDIPLGDTDMPIQVGVSSIDTGGHESLRSPPVTVYWPGPKI